MALRFGIIGFGRIGQRHAKVIRLHPDCEIAGYQDVTEQAAAEGVTYYPTVEELVQTGRCDVICVSTPNGLHAENSLKALQSGAHVICEKPLALNSDNARAMLDSAVEAGKHLVCVLQNRYSPHARWLKHAVESGQLGEIFQVQVNCFWNRDQRYFKTPDGTNHPWHGNLMLDGGPLFTQFSHYVDLLIWLFGDLQVSNGIFRNYSHKSAEYEDGGKFDFTFGTRGIGSFHYSIAVWDQNQESSITIIGSKGSVRLAGQYMNALEYCHVEGVDHPDFDHYQPSTVLPEGAPNHYYVVDNLVRAIQNGSAVDFDIKDAIQGVRLIETVYQEREL